MKKSEVRSSRKSKLCNFAKAPDHMQFAGGEGESTSQKGGGGVRLRQTGCEARRGPHPRLTLAEPELEIWVEGRPERGDSGCALGGQIFTRLTYLDLRE